MRSKVCVDNNFNDRENKICKELELVLMLEIKLKKVQYQRRQEKTYKKQIGQT
jgi:hypothetical protein